MSISYKSLTNYSKFTLPSVESWGTNNNILRDPPKAIMTRRIDKIGETSELNGMLEESPDRICENINKFARGVNPFVSVDYSNYGSNGGGGSFTIGGGSGSAISTGQARYPYPSIQNGFFRPPVKTQDELLPLSRLRRPFTEAFTNPEVVDYTKRTRMCGDDTNTKEVKRNIISTSANNPTKNFIIEKPVPMEGPTIRYSTVSNPMKTSEINSGMRTIDKTQRHVSKPTKNITNNNLSPNATTNISAYTKGKETEKHSIDTDRYINSDILHSNVSSSMRGKDTTDIRKFMGSVALPIKNSINVEGFTNRSGLGDGIRYNFENEYSLKRNIPQATFHNQQIPRSFDSMQNMGRDVHLKDKITPQGFEGKTSQPLLSRQSGQTSQAIQQQNISNQVLETMQTRFSRQFPN